MRGRSPRTVTDTMVDPDADPRDKNPAAIFRPISSDTPRLLSAGAKPSRRYLRRVPDIGLKIFGESFVTLIEFDLTHKTHVDLERTISSNTPRLLSAGAKPPHRYLETCRTSFEQNMASVSRI